MARAHGGWVDTERNDRLQEFWRSNVPIRPQFQKKIQHLPPLQIHYDSPRSPTGKEWTDQSLLSIRSVDHYLAESDAFQRASFTNIVEKCKEYNKNKTSRLISSFDSQYNMKLRFRHDEQLNRSPETKYASVAKYYRFLGNENNPKNTKPCKRHKRRTQEYEERHLRELLKLPPVKNSRSESYFLSKRTKLPSIDSPSLVK